MTPSESVRVGNFSGFYGDRADGLSALLHSEVDYVTGDFLAELTMSILNKSRRKDERQGYARTFVGQLRENLSTIVEREVKVITNAGGVAPRLLAELLDIHCREAGYLLKVAVVDGDDLLKGEGSGVKLLRHLHDHRPIDLSGEEVTAANCYFGAFGIAKALELGADVVITGRVTDAALAMGPAIYFHGWVQSDFDQLAGALVAGHIIECGSQACGGNYSFIDEIEDPGLFGLPIAEIFDDGSSLITKSANSGGVVSIGTIKSQLLYEISSPLYLNPDVIADFSTIKLSQIAKNEVRVSETRGLAPTDDLKVSLLVDGGYRNSMTAVITGLDPKKKADLLIEHLKLKLDIGQFDSFETELTKAAKDDPPSNEEANSYLKVSVASSNEELAGRRFSNAIVELALSNYAGFHSTTPPGSASRFDRYIPALIERSSVVEMVSLIGVEDSQFTVEGTGNYSSYDELALRLAAIQNDRTNLGSLPETTTVTMAPLGAIVGARSGDKGGDCNIGLFVNDSPSYEWLEEFLTEEKFKSLFPDFAKFRVLRYRFNNLLALNFIVEGLLGDGVSSSTRNDPQGKGAGEYVRSRIVPIPTNITSLKRNI